MHLDALELLGPKTGLARGLDLTEEVAREPERLPRLLARCLATPDDVARPAEASACRKRFSC
jgi:hypothetical protein